MSDAIRFSRAEARFEYRERYDHGSRYNERHLQAVSIETRQANRFVVHFPESDEAHVVELAADEGEYVGQCSCGDFEYRQTVCKHMWAVLADPHTAVLDRSATTSSDSRRALTDGGAVAATSSTNGKAPTYGDHVEVAVAKRFDLELIDAPFYDARATNETPKLKFGTPVQIKGTQSKIRNGYDANGNQKYTAGRLTFWREELLHLLEDDGRYVVAVYDDDRQAGEKGFLDGIRALTPKEVGEVAGDSWHPAHRPSKGERAKVNWKRILGGDPDV